METPNLECVVKRIIKYPQGWTVKYCAVRRVFVIRDGANNIIVVTTEAEVKKEMIEFENLGEEVFGDARVGEVMKFGLGAVKLESGYWIRRCMDKPAWEFMEPNEGKVVETVGIYSAKMMGMDFNEIIKNKMGASEGAAKSDEVICDGSEESLDLPDSLELVKLDKGLELVKLDKGIDIAYPLMIGIMLVALALAMWVARDSTEPVEPAETREVITWDKELAYMTEFQRARKELKHEPEIAMNSNAEPDEFESQIDKYRYMADREAEFIQRRRDREVMQLAPEMMARMLEKVAERLIDDEKAEEK